MTGLAAAIGELTGKWRATAELARAAVPGDGTVDMTTLAIALDACADEADATVELSRPAPAPADGGGFAASVQASAEAFAASVTDRRT